MCASPQFLRDWYWLYRHFGEYELVYLDPMVCDLLVEKPWHRNRFSTLSPEKVFLQKLTETLTADSKVKDLRSCLKRGQLTQKAADERGLQVSVAKVIEDFFPQQFSVPLSYLLQPKSQLARSEPPIIEGSLVLVDGMFARRAALPPSLQLNIDTRYMDVPEPRKRSVECILLNTPIPITTWDEGILGLMIDTVTFYQRATTALMRSDWYPFVQVLGKYATNHDGNPFVDVVALLAKPHPALDRVLRVPIDEELCCLPGMLTRVKEQVLDGEVNRLAKETTAPVKFYDKDRKLLYPIYFALLCCQLNGVDWSSLQSKAPHVAAILQSYMDQLNNLAIHLERLGMSSLIEKGVFDPIKLLPKPFTLP